MKDPKIKLIAIGLDENKKLQKNHFGQSCYFEIYNFSGKSIELRGNPFYLMHQHANAKEIQKVLPDCQIWVGIAMGARSQEYLESAGIRTFQITAEQSSFSAEKIIQFVKESINEY
jgi:predicted Fe-Mo cluster-binding NifX family protein